MNLAEGKIDNTYAIEQLNLPLNVEKHLESLGMISTLSILSYTIWIIQRKIKDIKRGKFCNCNCSNCASKNCK
ncbi:MULTISPECIES: FeoB-associated Cys-rich membrane protein [Clostridium]|uniref:FeoB-associated Cys-rich membrane protein n=1 Tax=Clostridium aquiflavi TaxID=3073603 RepID=A0ABU1EJC9_9CLOT|nr:MULTISPECIES: FeoB-associated Cys-rich membrane protein [unclassified Clostridium]MDR5588505.1 FeoB-associated Cys-rich membrane protein [Clostridium sp. 5N-1]NFG61684.1 hypothetical protein [Clostridium botulinum]NFQ08469.1 hypothetical protein [Clostridium botulinum]